MTSFLADMNSASKFFCYIRGMLRSTFFNDQERESISKFRDSVQKLRQDQTFDEKVQKFFEKCDHELKDGDSILRLAFNQRMIDEWISIWKSASESATDNAPGIQLFRNYVFFMSSLKNPDGSDRLSSLWLLADDAPGDDVQVIDASESIDRDQIDRSANADQNPSTSKNDHGKNWERSRFWERVCELKPELSGAIVYFCPTSVSLRCVINDDATISPVCALHTKFNSAVRFVDVLKSGRLKLPQGFKMPKGVSSTFYTFAQDFFLEAGRKDRIKDQFSPKVAKELFAIENSQERLQEFIPLDGIDLDAPIEVDVSREQPSGTIEEPPQREGEPPAATPEEAPPQEVEEEEEEEEDEGFELKEFWTVAIKVKPELTGKTVYFAPTLKKHLPCMVNVDGTFSPISDPFKKYTQAEDMALDIAQGRLHMGEYAFALHKSPILYTCVTDFFMDPRRCTSVLQYLGRFSRCSGIERAKFETLIREKRWETTGRALAPIAFDGKKIRSKNCTGVVVNQQLRCAECKKTAGSLWTNGKKVATGKVLPYEQKIKYIGNRYLTPEQQREKLELIRKDHKNSLRIMKRKLEQVSRLEAELKKYKPANPEDQAAIRGLVEHLNEENAKMTSPKCYWRQAEGGGAEICGVTTDTLADMCAHVNQVHHRSQVEANSGLAEEHRKFRCLWKGCGRQRPFPTAHQLHLHLFEHTGSRMSVQRLEILRNQLTNLGRATTARRYNEAVRRTVMNTDRSSLDTLRVNNSLPLPSNKSLQDMRRRERQQDPRRRALLDSALNEAIGTVLQRVNQQDFDSDGTARRLFGEESGGSTASAEVNGGGVAEEPMEEGEEDDDDDDDAVLVEDDEDDEDEEEDEEEEDDDDNVTIEDDAD